MLGFLLWFSLELGIQDTLSNYYSHAPMFIDTTINAESDNLHLYGSFRNEMQPTSLTNYYPTLDTYTLGASYHIGNFTFNVERSCTHPVLPWNREIERYNASHITASVEFRSK